MLPSMKVNLPLRLKNLLRLSESYPLLIIQGTVAPLTGQRAWCCTRKKAVGEQLLGEMGNDRGTKMLRETLSVLYTVLQKDQDWEPLPLSEAALVGCEQWKLWMRLY